MTLLAETTTGPRMDLWSQTFLFMQSIVTDPSDVYIGMLMTGDGRAPDLADLRTHVAGHLTRLPALTHRAVLAEGAATRWDLDPHFDLEAHITVLPEVPVHPVPAGTWMGGAPDLARPLWRMVLLPGDGTGGQWPTWSTTPSRTARRCYSRLRRFSADGPCLDRGRSRRAADTVARRCGQSRTSLARCVRRRRSQRCPTCRARDGR